MQLGAFAGAGRHEADAAPSVNHFRRVLNVPPLQKRQLEDPSTPSTPSAMEDRPSPSRGASREEQEAQTGSDDESPRNGRTSPSVVTESPEPTNGASSRTLSSEARTSTEEPESSSRSSETRRTPTSTSDESTSTVSTSSTSDESTSTALTSLTSASSPRTSSVLSRTTSSASTSSVESTTLAPSTTGTSTRSPSLAQSASSTVTTSARPSNTASSSDAAPAENEVSKSTVIVASVSGTLALIAIVLLVLFCVRRKRQKRRKVSNHASFAKDSLSDYPDTAFLTHSRTASGSTGTDYRDGFPAKVSRAVPSPTAVAYPPQGYTRPARAYPLANVGPGGPRVSRDASRGMHPPNWTRSSRGGAGDIAAGPSSIVGVGDGTLESNRPSSLFLPTSPVPPPPTKQQQQHMPRLLPQSQPHPHPHPQLHPPTQATYQAYKPFASKYHVPRINTDLDSRGSNSIPLRVDTASIARPYLPGEQARSPTTTTTTSKPTKPTTKNSIPATRSIGGAGRLF
ncbi:MAG: hypothetical protein M1815_001553 [Lichina confinis]|nr:MAG: hypothetical protein M1815_001553 [Lichina confinis]